MPNIDEGASCNKFRRCIALRFKARNSVLLTCGHHRGLLVSQQQALTRAAVGRVFQGRGVAAFPAERGASLDNLPGLSVYGRVQEPKLTFVKPPAALGGNMN